VILLWLVSALRIFAGLVALAVMVPLSLCCMIPLLPWRWKRLRMANRWGTALGSTLMWLSGCKLTFVNRESIGPHRQLIYAGNHTTIYDTFISIWLAPLGTVGVAKKQIIYYPIFGLAWLLSGNVSIDRSKSGLAKDALNELASLMLANKLSVWMWPEGRRSKDGRIQPFKKGLAHLALRTGLPIVPVVIENGHRAWKKGTLLLRAVPVKITFLPAIETTAWTEENLEQHLEEVRGAFIRALPEDQVPRPLDLALSPVDAPVRDVREGAAAHRDHRRSVDADRTSSEQGRRG
jgi:1-acyl-sn-glycerol-3-phosphate acyltransferase